EDRLVPGQLAKQRPHLLHFSPQALDLGIPAAVAPLHLGQGRLDLLVGLVSRPLTEDRADPAALSRPAPLGASLALARSVQRRRQSLAPGPAFAEHGAAEYVRADRVTVAVWQADALDAPGVVFQGV